MTRARRAVTIPLLALGLGAGAVAPLGNLALQPESRIWVKGTSTVRDYTCNAKTIDAAVSARGPDASALSLQQLVDSARVSVAVAALDCGNGTMNEHMRKALKANDHPRLLFELASYEIGAAGVVTLKGTLTLAGRALPVEIAGTIAEQEGGVIRVSATQQIKNDRMGHQAALAHAGLNQGA